MHNKLICSTLYREARVTWEKFRKIIKLYSVFRALHRVRLLVYIRVTVVCVTFLRFYLEFWMRERILQLYGG